jgi:ketosteroid isomerase-like protein
MEKTQIENKAQEFIDALHTLENGSIDDVGQLVDLFAEDAMLNNSALDSKEQTLEGRDAILRFWTQYKESLGQAKSEFRQITFNQSAAGLFWETEGTNPAGDKVNYHGATLLEFSREGQITYFRGYYDTRELVLKAEKPD